MGSGRKSPNPSLGQLENVSEETEGKGFRSPSLSVNVRRPTSGYAADSVVAGLLIALVGPLFVGYLDPDVPYDGLAVLPLLSSFLVLFWANRRADLLARSAPTGS